MSGTTRAARSAWLALTVVWIGCGGDGPRKAEREDAGPGGSGPRPRIDAGLEAPPDGGSPLDASSPGVDRDDGEPCADHAECRSGTCLNDAYFVGGYCSSLDCRSDLDCNRPTGHCVEQGGGFYCAKPCDAQNPCRTGYSCSPPPTGGPSSCIPTAAVAAQADGDPCLSDEQCRGGTCFRDPAWPAGHCTTRNCASAASCASIPGVSHACVGAFRLYPEAFCARSCRSDGDCRAGYVCAPAGGDQRACAPNVASPPLAGRVEDLPFTMRCGVPVTNGRATIEYTVAGDAASYMITPFARDGRYVVPLTIELPSGGTIDFSGANRFQRRSLDLHGFISPTVVPATAQLQSQLEAGRHRFLVETHSEDLCYYMLDEIDPGTRLDLNFYLVGVPGLSAATASTDPNLQALLTRLDTVLGQAAIDVQVARYIDVVGSDAQRFSILRDLTEVTELARRSVQPAGALAESLSVNVFLVQGFAGAEGLDGLSLGLPGPAGLHGTRASAVIISAEVLGEIIENPKNQGPLAGNDYMGVVLAHELGHFLGLIHTSETDRVTFDPIEDTPECRSTNFPDGCADIGNLMFPYTSSLDGLTAGQAAMLRANPLTK